MDNITHTLVGAALGHAGLKRRTPLALTTLIIGANLPDVDGITYFTGGALAFRRGWTHGILAMVVLPFLLTGAVVLGDRVLRRRARPDVEPARPREVLLLAFAAILLHPFLDFLNTYGVRFLMPFRNTWFYGDAWNIADLWVWLALGMGVGLSSWLDRHGRPPRTADRPALGALALARGKARARDVILVAAFAYASLRASRNILYFALVSFPILVEYVGQWFDTQRTWQWLSSGPNPKITGVMNVVVLLVLTGVVGMYARQVIERQPQLQLATYPVRAVNFIQASHPPAPLYNTYDWGGYLIWQLYPEYQVFIDGRADVYNDPFFRAYADAQNDEFKGQALFKQYGIRTAIFHAGDALADTLSRDPAWQVIFRDSVAVVLTKK